MVEPDQNTDAAALLALMHVPGVGNGGARSALHAARQLKCDIASLITMTPRALLDGLPPGDHQALAQAIGNCEESHREAGQRLIARCAKAGISVLTIEDERYPDTVRVQLGERAPVILSVIGNLELIDHLGIGVVGAREVSDAGGQLARTCGRDVARVDRVLISGGANGVDDSGQRGAADADGRLVVVLPQGLLKFRGPPYFRDVLRERRALLMSASLPDAPWQRHAAVERNDIIAALSEAVCAIEPKKTGGSIRTARTALEYGRYVLVQCTSDSAQGCAALIREGARPLIEGETLGEGWLSKALTSESPRVVEQTSLPGLDA
jgi:DNA processing protein